jgi:AcrR family transcriptional regulator
VNASSARASFRSQLRETARATILDAAEELIATRADVPLVQIAKRAGIAVGTLYNYFTDREALVAALFETRRATLRPMISAALKANVDLAFEPRLRAFVKDLVGACEAHRRFIKISMEVSQRPSVTTNDVRAAIKELVKAGVREGAIAPRRADLFALVFHGGVRAVLLDRVADGAPLDRDVDELVSILLDGARA